FAIRIILTAAQAEVKPALPPHFYCPRAFLAGECPVRCHPKGLWHTFSPCGRQSTSAVAPFFRNAVFSPVILGWRQHEVTGILIIVVRLCSNRVRQESTLIIMTQHVIVVLPTLPTELDWHIQPAWAGEHLTLKREVSLVSGLQRREQRAPLRDKLVQFECERSTSVCTQQFTATT